MGELDELAQLQFVIALIGARVIGFVGQEVAPRDQFVAAHLGIPLLGSLPLDPNLALWCDEGRIEDYRGADFALIVEAILERTPATKTVPIFAK